MTAAAPRISYISGHMILGAEIDDGMGSEFVFHLPDALGSTRDVVDSSGNVIRSFEHDEYGNLLSSSGTGAATPKTWIGGLSVNDDTADSGLWNMGHRNYAGGVLGRFISRDPIGFNGSSLNLYAYPTNPVNFLDPTGLEPKELTTTCRRSEGTEIIAFPAVTATYDTPESVVDGKPVPWNRLNINLSLKFKAPPLKMASLHVEPSEWGSHGWRFYDGVGPNAPNGGNDLMFWLAKTDKSHVTAVPGRDAEVNTTFSILGADDLVNVDITFRMHGVAVPSSGGCGWMEWTVSETFKRSRRGNYYPVRYDKRKKRWVHK